MVMRTLDFRPRQVGLAFHKLPLQLLVGLTGIPFGILEFYVVRPQPLVSSLDWGKILLPALILLVCTGFVEELTFRGVMQKSAVESLGHRGWLYVAGLFAVLHIGYLSVADFGLVLLVGFFFGWVVQETESLVGVSRDH